MNMKFTLPAASLVLLFAASCKKDSGSKSAIDGNWTFSSVNASTSSSITVDDGGGVIEKDVTTSEYTSTDNKGTVSIGGGVINVKGLAYTVNTTATETYYINDVQQDQQSAPFSFTLPATNSTANFKLVGTDSIYFPNGGFSSLAGGSVSAPSGAKYTLSGNTLTIISKLDTTFTDNSLGFPALKHDVATQSTVLTKQ